MRCHPHLSEINARLFIRRLSEKYGRILTLATVPEEEWQSLRNQGFDIIWLMGVWQRSPGARREALLNPWLHREYDQVLPDWTENDIVGSPYAIHNYRLDSILGEPEELAQLKSRLNRFDLRLIVDFVPDHLAIDYPWTLSHPQRFVQGKGEAIKHHPDWFFLSKDDVYLAHGRDPNFSPWTDSAQLNFYSADLRQALTSELLHIAKTADGVRCDMAMLALNDVFELVWGGLVTDYPRPMREFWTEAIERVKQQHPDFLFLAEAYWGYERKLQQLGFDFTYDKALYDRLRYATPDDIRQHLMTDSSYLEHSVHFIENHDEPRAVTAFGRERSATAAIVFATVPGLRLFHDGQLDGYRLHLPVQLGREPKENPDLEMKQFYDQLLAICNAPAFHEGQWRLIEASSAWEGNESHHNLLSWSWIYGEQVKIVVVNYSPHPAQGWLKLSLRWATTKSVTILDELTRVVYDRDPLELNHKGLYVDLAPWHAHILDTTVY